MTFAAEPGDSRFFARSGPHPLGRIAEIAGAELSGGAADTVIHGVAPLAAATERDVSFIDNRRYLAALSVSQAAAVLVHPDLRHRVPPRAASLVTASPYLGWARVVALFHPAPAVSPGRHPSAVIDATARIDPSAEIAPLAVIGAGAEIGARTRIGPHAVVGDGVVIGPDCRIGAHASISHALLGARVTLWPGARIGQEGFGFAMEGASFVTVPQVGRVILEDDVEIGANTTVDRGAMQDTVIGAGSRLDNLVMIGHNVRLGRGCVVVSQAGVSGSTVLDDFVQLGGQAGLTGHLHIGRKARIGAQAGVMSDVPAGADVVGSPAVPIRSFFRQVAVLRRLTEQGGTKDKPEGGRQGGVDAG